MNTITSTAENKATLPSFYQTFHSVNLFPTVYQAFPSSSSLPKPSNLEKSSSDYCVRCDLVGKGKFPTFILPCGDRVCLKCQSGFHPGCFACSEMFTKNKSPTTTNIPLISTIPRLNFINTVVEPTKQTQSLKESAKKPSSSHKHTKKSKKHKKSKKTHEQLKTSSSFQCKYCRQPISSFGSTYFLHLSKCSPETFTVSFLNYLSNIEKGKTNTK